MSASSAVSVSDDYLAGLREGYRLALVEAEKAARGPARNHAFISDPAYADGYTDRESVGWYVGRHEAAEAVAVLSLDEDAAASARAQIDALAAFILSEVPALLLPAVNEQYPNGMSAVEEAISGLRALYAVTQAVTRGGYAEARVLASHAFPHGPDAKLGEPPEPGTEGLCDSKLPTHVQTALSSLLALMERLTDEQLLEVFRERLVPVLERRGARIDQSGEDRSPDGVIPAQVQSAVGMNMLVAWMATLEPEQRVEVFEGLTDHYCPHCGFEQPERGCQCMNDA